MPSPIKCFISYSHKNTPEMEKVIEAITPLQNNGTIEILYDRNFNHVNNRGILPVQIADALEDCNIFLALFSPSYCVSNVVNNIEMLRALERHKLKECTIIPIILEQCAWYLHPLGRQAQLYVDVKDKDFYKVCVKLGETVKSLNKSYYRDLFINNINECGDAYLVKNLINDNYIYNKDINKLSEIDVDIKLPSGKELYDYTIPKLENSNRETRNEKIHEQYQEQRQWIQNQRYSDEFKNKINEILENPIIPPDDKYHQKFLLTRLPEGAELMELTPVSEIFRTSLNNRFIDDYYRYKQDVHNMVTNNFNKEPNEALEVMESRNIWSLYRNHYYNNDYGGGRYVPTPPLSFLFNEYSVETSDNKMIIIKKDDGSNILRTICNKRGVGINDISLFTATDENGKYIKDYIKKNEHGKWILNYYDLMLNHLKDFFNLDTTQAIEKIIATINLHSIVLQKNTFNSALLSHVKLNIASSNVFFQGRNTLQFKTPDDIEKDMIKKFKYSDNYNSKTEWHSTAPHRLLYWLNSL